MSALVKLLAAGALASAAASSAATLDFSSGDRVVGRFAGYDGVLLRITSPLVGDIATETGRLVHAALGDVVVTTKAGDRLTGSVEADADGLGIQGAVGKARITWGDVAIIVPSNAAPATSAALSTSENPSPAASPQRRTTLSASYNRSSLQEADLLAGRSDTVRDSLSLAFERRLGTSTAVTVGLPLTHIAVNGGATNSSDWRIGDTSVSAAQTIEGRRLAVQLSAIAVLPTGNATLFDVSTGNRVTSGYFGAGVGATVIYPVGHGTFIAGGSYTRLKPRKSGGGSAFNVYEGFVGATVALSERWQLAGIWRINGLPAAEPTYFDLSLNATLTERLSGRLTFTKGIGLDAEDGAIGFGLSWAL